MFINVAFVTQNWNNIAPNVYMSTIVLLSSVLFAKKSTLSISVCFHKIYLVMAFCTFGRFEIPTITPNRLKNENNDTLKLLGHNCNHLQQSVKQKMSLSIIGVLS